MSGLTLQQTSLRGATRACPPLAGRPATRGRPARGALQTVAYKPPSSRAAETELASLERLTTVVPDTLLGDDRGSVEAPNSAIVSSAVLAGILANPTGLRQFENAIEKAVSYDKCFIPGTSAAAKNACQYDKALTNIGAMYLDSVTGVVSTEVDPRTFDSVDAMVARGKQIIDMYKEDGITTERVTLRLPATFKGIAATKKLAAQGIRVHLTGVYSLPQAAAAIDAGAALLQVHVGRVKDWYANHPGVIRDPHGPREDSGAVSANCVGLTLATSVYDLTRAKGAQTQVMVVGVRSKSDVIALAGVDYMVLGAKLLNELSAAPTLAGYNDGLHVAGADPMPDGITPALTPAAAAAATFKPEDVALHTSAEKFELALGYAAQELLAEHVEDLTKDVGRTMDAFERLAVSPGE